MYKKLNKLNELIDLLNRILREVIGVDRVATVQKLHDLLRTKQIHLLHMEALGLFKADHKFNFN